MQHLVLKHRSTQVGKDFSLSPLVLLSRPERLLAGFARSSLAARRPSARFARLVELPTPWFEACLEFCIRFRVNKLDGPPSLNFTPRFVESRQVWIQPYVLAFLRLRHEWRYSLDSRQSGSISAPTETDFDLRQRLWNGNGSHKRAR